MGQSKHVRRLDVEPEDRSSCRQKASIREFGHRAKKIGHCAKEIRCYEKTCRLGNTLKERMMRQRIGRSAKRTNDMLDNKGFACNQLYLNLVCLKYN